MAMIVTAMIVATAALVVAPASTTMIVTAAAVTMIVATAAIVASASMIVATMVMAAVVMTTVTVAAAVIVTVTVAVIPCRCLRGGESERGCHGEGGYQKFHFSDWGGYLLVCGPRVQDDAADNFDEGPDRLFMRLQIFLKMRFSESRNAPGADGWNRHRAMAVIRQVDGAVPSALEARRGEQSCPGSDD